MESFGLLFRALVMLACLALVPFLCLYGKRIPDFAQAVMEAYKTHTHADSPASSQTAAGGEAPPFTGAAGNGAPATLGSRGSNARPLGPQPGDHRKDASPASFIDSGDVRATGSSREAAGSGSAATPEAPIAAPPSA